VNSRGFVILLLIAVAASVACGLIVERYTAPGMERTLWFAIGLAAILFPAGKFAERRGWVHGIWRAGVPLGAEVSGTTPAPAAASAAASESIATPATAPAASAAPSAGAEAPSKTTGIATATAAPSSTTRPLSGEPT
jgi:hypothetical protein